MSTVYEVLTIKIYARDEDIDNDELALSDEVFDIQNALELFLKSETWLKDRKQASHFTFRVLDSTEKAFE